MTVESEMKNEGELHCLLDTLCNQTISVAEHERLCELLEADPQARQTYYERLEIDLRMSRWAGGEQLSQPFKDLPERHKLTLEPEILPTRQRGHFMMMALIAAALLVGAFIFRNGFGNGDQSLTAGAPGSSPINVAALVQSADCVWQKGNEPQFNGQQMLTSEIVLEKGTAEFLLGSGALLVLDGPSRLTFQSDSQAMLHHGNVVLNGDDMREEFALHTPNAVLFDEGTEFGVTVDSNEAETEIHVFEGRVRVETNAGNGDPNAANDVVTMGSASLINSSGAESLELKVQRFVRRIPSDRLPQISPSKELIASEDFNYAGPEIGPANGGQGWAGPWRRDVVNFDPSKAQIIPHEPLFSAALNRKGAGGHLLQDGRGSALRPLSNPIRMDMDAEYYLSFVIKKSRESPRGVTQYGSVSLRPSSQENFVVKKILFGVTSENNVIMNHCSDQTITNPTLETGETYCYVAKIVARESSPDAVMLRVYSPEEKIGDSEPTTWTCESPLQDDNAIYRNLFIYVGGDAAFEVDQIRIGSTWHSVANDE